MLRSIRLVSSFSSAMVHPCPSEAVLRQFNEGRIDSPTKIDRITEHLGLCEICIDTLESMAPGPIVEGLRESVSNRLIADDEQLLEQDLDLESMRGSLDQIILNAGRQLSDPVDPSRFGENRYHVIAPIGEGDFSCVFGASAEDRSPEDRPLTEDHGLAGESVELVRIKIPHSHKLTSNRHTDQFFEDCQNAQSLRHPGIQEVLEFGHWDETHLFLSNPLLAHPTLTKFARSLPCISHETMLSIFNQLVDVVQYAHQQNVIHRHLTPDNIHVFTVDRSHAGNAIQPKPEIRVMVSDFGFVLDSRYHFDLIERPSTQTPFISPESATLLADYIDERTDIYSLGKNLKLLLRLTSNPRDEVRVKKIIDKSTFARRRDRYQTVSELKAALDVI